VAAGAKITSAIVFQSPYTGTPEQQREKQDLVYFSPPATPVFELPKSRGYIDGNAFGGYQAMIKKIVAEPGDTVSVTD